MRLIMMSARQGDTIASSDIFYLMLPVNGLSLSLL